MRFIRGRTSEENLKKSEEFGFRKKSGSDRRESCRAGRVLRRVRRCGVEEEEFLKDFAKYKGLEIRLML